MNEITAWGNNTFHWHIKQADSGEGCSFINLSWGHFNFIEVPVQYQMTSSFDLLIIDGKLFFHKNHVEKEATIWDEINEETV